jgi:hypothetical protein
MTHIVKQWRLALDFSNTNSIIFLASQIFGPLPHFFFMTKKKLKPNNSPRDGGRYINNAPRQEQEASTSRGVTRGGLGK